MKRDDSRHCIRFYVTGDRWKIVELQDLVRSFVTCMHQCSVTDEHQPCSPGDCEGELTITWVYGVQPDFT
jgi:hypothetical protein